VVLAGQVLVGSREMRALGVESAYSLVDLVGEERALDAPADALADLAERAARSWSR
jgi:glycerate kinase